MKDCFDHPQYARAVAPPCQDCPRFKGGERGSCPKCGRLSAESARDVYKQILRSVYEEEGYEPLAAERAAEKALGTA